jgi:hypothetical protein
MTTTIYDWDQLNEMSDEVFSEEEKYQREKALRHAKANLDPVSYLQFKFIMHQQKYVMDKEKDCAKEKLNLLKTVQHAREDELRKQTNVARQKRDGEFLNAYNLRNWSRSIKSLQDNYTFIFYWYPWDNRSDKGPYHSSDFRPRSDNDDPYAGDARFTRISTEENRPGYWYGSRSRTYRGKWIDYLTKQKEIIKSIRKNAVNLRRFQQADPTFIWAVMELCFPPLDDYINNGGRATYPYFKGYMEEMPWPTPDVIDLCIKDVFLYGSLEFAENNIPWLQYRIQRNINPHVQRHIHANLPTKFNYTDSFNYGPTPHYGIQLENPHYDPVAELAQRRRKPDGNNPLKFPFPYEWAKKQHEYDSARDDIRRKFHASGEPIPASGTPYWQALKAYAVKIKHPWGSMPDGGLVFDQGTRYTDWHEPLAVGEYGRGEGLKDRDNWPREAKKYVANPTTPYWMWPRPKSGHINIPKLGYVNPFYWDMTKEIELDTVWYNEVERQREAARRDRWNHLMDFFGNVADGIKNIASGNIGDFFSGVNAASRFGGWMLTGNTNTSAIDLGWRAAGFTAANIWMAANPIHRDITSAARGEFLYGIIKMRELRQAYKDMEYFTGGLLSQMARVEELPAKVLRGDPVSEQDILEALDLAIKAGIIIFSGGSAAAVIGVSAGQLKRGTIGETELGRTLLGAAEIAAIAAVAGAGIQSALQDYAVGQGIEVAKKEAGEATGLDQTILGRLSLSVAGTTTYNVYKSMPFTEALSAGASSGTRAQAARENPHVAIAIVAGSEVEKHGIESLLPGGGGENLDPVALFKKLDFSRFGPDVVNGIQSIATEDAMRMIGLVVAVKAGYVKENDAYWMVAQEASVRNIQRFHGGQPVRPLSQDEKRIAAVREESNKAKRQQSVVRRVQSGEIPSGEDLALVTGDQGAASYFSNSVNENVPESERSTAWGAIFDIGFPDLGFKLPGINFPDMDLSFLNIFGGSGAPESEGSTQHDFDPIDWPNITVSQELQDKMNESLARGSRDMFKKYLMQFIYSLFPRGYPLRPVGSRDPLDFNFFDRLGNLQVRKPLQFPYDHPMLKHNLVKKKLTPEEEAYRKARIIEVNRTLRELQALQAEIGRLQSTIA